jgi:hypothetical protein
MYGSTFFNPLASQNTFNYDLDRNYQSFLPASIAWSNNGPVRNYPVGFLPYNSASTIFFFFKPQFLIKIYTDNIVSTSGSDINMNELIDFYVIEFNINEDYIPTIGSASLNRETFSLVSGIINGNRTRLGLHLKLGKLFNSKKKSSYRFQSSISSISFQISMKCSTNYYTETCSVRCVPQDDCTGHYDCDQHTGAKICKYGFYEPETDCQKRNQSIILCPTFGNIQFL